MWISKSDLRYTLRQMGKKPGFVLLAALILSGGLAVSLMAFTVSYSMIYGTLPVTNGERIVRVCPWPERLDCAEFRADDFSRIRTEITSLANVGIYTERQGLRIEYANEEWLDTGLITDWNLFQLSESQAQLGRILQPEDQEPGAEAVAVIGHRLWQRRFAGDPGIVGTVISIDRVPVRIVGVMPEGYRMPSSSDLWLPVSSQVSAPLDSLNPMPLVKAYGLLKPGISKQQASGEINRLMAQNRAQHPADPFAKYPYPYLKYINEASTGHVEYFPLAVFGGTAGIIITTIANVLTLLVFLLVCINVSTLLLARINERMKDTSIRVALGASRIRLLVQICLESVLVTCLGAVLAVLLAGIGMELIALVVNSMNENLLAFWMDFRIDGTTLIGVALYVIFTVALTSVIPGWRVINGNFNAAMRDGTRGALGLRTGRFSKGLVMAALMIVTLLMYMLTLLGSSIIPISNTLSSMPDNMVGTTFILDSQRYDEEERQQFAMTLNARMADEPGIEYARFTVGYGSGSVEAEGVASVAGEEVNAQLSAEIFTETGEINTHSSEATDDSMAISLLEGRGFTEADTRNSDLVVTISQSLSRHLWPGESALDRRLRIVGKDNISEDWRRVVGVVTDIAMSTTLGGNPRNAVMPLTQMDTEGVPFNLLAFATSAAGKGRVADYLREEIAALDSSLDPQIRDLETSIDALTKALGFGTLFGIVVGGFILAVAIAGIYGLTYNSVLMASHEIGVRRALGARDRLIAFMFMKRSARQVLIGFISAMLLCAPMTYLFVLISQELNLNLSFSLTMSALVIIILYAVVFLATYMPVRKILRLEPGDALRYE